MIMYKVLVGLFVAFVLVGGCVRGAAMGVGAPEPVTKSPVWTPRPSPTYVPPAPAETAEPTTDDPGDVHVDVDTDDDDRRNSRWCPTRWC